MELSAVEALPLQHSPAVELRSTTATLPQHPRKRPKLPDHTIQKRARVTDKETFEFQSLLQWSQVNLTTLSEAIEVLAVSSGGLITTIPATWSPTHMLMPLLIERTLWLLDADRDSMKVTVHGFVGTLTPEAFSSTVDRALGGDFQVAVTKPLLAPCADNSGTRGQAAQ